MVSIFFQTLEKSGRITLEVMISELNEFDKGIGALGFVGWEEQGDDMIFVG